ncbi:MAG: dihydropteroate synthase [Flavobacteriales bacterium]|nr:dihydropteroate synthase [Flavobacteriales bacterium]
MLKSPLVMGILNLNDDSFYDGSRVGMNGIGDRAAQMIAEGADVLDLGVFSSRPGATMGSEQEEIDRLIPAIKELHERFPGTTLSVDTARSKVVREAVNAGASMVNDIYAGHFDPHMATVIGELQVPYILMHMQGEPENMQRAPSYKHLLSEIASFFDERIRTFQAAGANDLILDPGFGFGKTPAHNFELIRNLSYFRCFERPIMIGISRKSSIARLLNTDTDHALNGTTALHVVALQQGASILRVHDVKPAVEAIKITEACI